jgi:hypothetical protein
MENTKKKVVYLKSNLVTILISQKGANSLQEYIKKNQEGLFSFSDEEGNTEFVVDLQEIIAIK